MQGRNGISTATPNRLIFDSGELFLNIDTTALETPLDDDYIMSFMSASQPFVVAPRFDLADTLAPATSLGATRGGASFNPGRKIREIDVDGSLGPVYRMRRREGVTPTLTATLLEVSRHNLQTAITGAQSQSAGGFQRLRGGPTVDGTYIDNVALLATYSGSVHTGRDNPVVMVVTDALVTEINDVSLEDHNEPALEVTFTGHFDPGYVDYEPWIIYHPEDL
jgi:hypothetical protein